MDWERLLKRIDLGSNCCWAPIIDHGNTGEWICSDCKEHCSQSYSQQISLMVLTTNWWCHHHILEYNSAEDPDEDLNERVIDRVDDHYNVNDCWYCYSQDKYLEFLDHSKT